LQFTVWVAAVADLGDVVGGEVCAWVWRTIPSRAPVAVFCAVVVDCGFATCTVAWFVDLGGCGGAAVAVLVSLMLGASAVGLEVGAAGD